jgi:hypothetical protein
VLASIFLSRGASKSPLRIIIIYLETVYLKEKYNVPWNYRYFRSSVNLIYSWHFFFLIIGMNNSEEAIFCLAVREKFTCSWLIFPSYWTGTKTDNSKITYICVLNTFWHFPWNNCSQCSRNAYYFIQKIEGTSVSPDSPEAENYPPG